MRWTVKEIKKYCDDNELKLLSSYASDFWEDYVDGHAAYDRAFERLFKNFVFFEEEHETIADAATAFIVAVSDHLMLNDKKYSELYRINVINDENYSLTNNYDMTETRNGSGSVIHGSRTDSSSATLGQQTVTGKVSPFDDSSFSNASENTSGQRIDSGSFTSGQQSDTTSDSYTLTRSGNIGTMTATDMLEKHSNYWTKFDFYNYIFMAISRDLLMVD